MAALADAGRGQQDAARALYERFYTSVYRYALSQVRSPQDAEDATQNTFLRAFAALQRGVVPDNEAAWLFKIAHNVCLSSKLAWLRRRRVETPRDLDELPVPPIALEHQRDELFGLDDALAAMPARLREAFLLREWQGLSYAEIAERLDTSHSAVETLIFRARRTLAAQLDAPVQRARRALGLGQLLVALRSLLGGGSIALKTAAVVAVVVGATVAAQPLVHSTPAHHRQQPALAPGAPVVSSTSPAARRTPRASVPATTRPARGGGATLPQPAAVLPAQPDAPSLTPPAKTPTATSPLTGLPAVPTGSAAATVPATPELPPAPAVSVPAVPLPAATVPEVTVPAVTVPLPPLP